MKRRERERIARAVRVTGEEGEQLEKARRLLPGDGGTCNGIPVHYGTSVQIVEAECHDGHRVLLGIGPEDGAPVAYAVLCPCCTGWELIGQLTEAAANADEADHDADYEDEAAAQ